MTQPGHTPPRTIPQYQNRWMPATALDILAEARGPILDLGGAAAPFARADKVIDILPFNAARLERDTWGGERRPWLPKQYLQWDACAGQPLPLASHSFALGLCSHTLEDLRDPLPVLAELGRVCEQLLIITPSRLVEHTFGIDHPKVPGFSHHPWMVFRDEQGLVFQRKTGLMNLRGCHVTCPFGRTLAPDRGTFLYHGPAIAGRELAFWRDHHEVDDHRAFIKGEQEQGITWIDDGFGRGLRRRAYHTRQRWFGAV